MVEETKDELQPLRKAGEPATREKKLLVLTCPTCKSQNKTPLTVEKHKDWAKTAAYMYRLKFCSEDVELKVGDVLNVHVDYPVCCLEGEVFSATPCYDDSKFVTMRLLNIKKYKVYSAKLRVRILAMGNMLTHVKPVPEEVKQRLVESHSYDYKAPNGDNAIASYGHMDKNIVQFYNSLGGGDITYNDYIFTDGDGLDHLVESCYSDFDNSVAYFGDKVIGFHADSPYFPPRPTLPDGSLAPFVPYGFVECLQRIASYDGIIPYLQSTITNVKNKGGNIMGISTTNGLFTGIYLYWVGHISIPGFVYAMKTMIDKVVYSDDTVEDKVIQQLYNELVRELRDRSKDGQSIEKFMYVTP